jgi:mono/diheme cytochrome c family protein
LPDYTDATLPVATRARAYLEINCAHCHQPGGMAGNTSLMLGYFTPYAHTGIEYNRQNMIVRMTAMGEYHMPKIGTTIVHEEGLQLVKQYIKTLQKAN